MDLSVIIVNWNTKGLLLQCLTSVYERIVGQGSEVFVVDNGSRDGSNEAVQEKFPNVKLIRNQKNLGFAMANNKALCLSKGKYLLLLNPDTQVKEGAIEKLISFMDTHPDTGIAGGQLLNSDGSKQNSIANFPSLATELLNKRLLRWLFPKKFPGKEKNYSDPIEVDSVIGACMMVKRDAMEQVGFLNEDYFLFLEETDWCYRMKQASWKVYHVPQAEIIHSQGKTANFVKEKAKIEYYRSLYLFFEKHRGDIQSMILKTLLFIRFSMDFIIAVLSCLFTLFMQERSKRRLLIYGRLVYWHFRFCPDGMGLREN